MKKESFERVERILQKFRDAGMMNGPCTYGPDLMEPDGEKPYIEFGWSIPRIADGYVRYYNRKFILVGSSRQMSNQPDLVLLYDNVDDIDEWLEQKRWL